MKSPRRRAARDIDEGIPRLNQLWSRRGHALDRPSAMSLFLFGVSESCTYFDWHRTGQTIGLYHHSLGQAMESLSDLPESAMMHARADYLALGFEGSPWERRSQELVVGILGVELGKGKSQSRILESRLRSTMYSTPSAWWLVLLLSMGGFQLSY